MKLHPLFVLTGLAWLASRNRHTVVPRAESSPDVKPKPPPVYAYLYQLPEDGFSTTRMAFGDGRAEPKEMGLFGSPESAKTVAAQKGWLLAWDGVKQLKVRPGE